jgi:hypothetical protein
MMACGMGQKGLKGLLLMAACCGAPILLFLALPVLGSALGALGTSALSTLAVLACPIGMALMMWMMLRAQRAETQQSAPAQPTARPRVASMASAEPQEAIELPVAPATVTATLALPPATQEEVATLARSVNGHQMTRPPLTVNGQQAPAPTAAGTKTQAATPPHE